MGEIEAAPAAGGQPVQVTPDPTMVTITHLIYGLHAFSVLIGLTSAATVVGAFVFGVPSIVAVILNYAQRGAVRGTLLESHFRWQIRTFWYAALWILVAVVLLLTIIGIPLALLVFCGAGIWVIYRVARGWIALNDRRPMYAATGGRP
jgi:uncharacterized membrane protein